MSQKYISYNEIYYFANENLKYFDQIESKKNTLK